MLIAEMLAIHFCSDQDQTLAVLAGLLTEVKRRITSNTGVLQPGAARIFWVNPVADLQIMNLLEECGGRICGTEYLFNHALEMIPTDVEPMEALARMALADPMVGSSSDRAELICQKIAAFEAEGVVISRIPGASHCALEGTIIAEVVRAKLGIPVLEIEVPPISNAVRPALQNRINALIETIEQRRTQ
ncbi:MAG: 2-hydroxyglutaryl-CoA dehydratase, D-component [Planctomycetes bacterium ADurb.Bin412]|nr:MAG: 2-hydroxyglutaryl-CoA dehydratase, D-component [Planctomycetes bacterium ADurb.Bin412]